VPALLASPPLLGREQPRIFTPPLRDLTPDTTRGFEVIAFAEEILGITLTPWQKWLYIHALELLPTGRYRFRTLVILIARQNGKTLWVQILSLWALYVDGAQLVLGTAQNLDVAEECWQGSVDLAEGIPDLASEIASVNRTNGKKALCLQSGPRYKVAAASRRGGRGLTGDLVVLDELREHQTWDAWAAITKTTMARKDALVVCLSNAGDMQSVVLSHQRDLGILAIEEGNTDSRIGLFEYSAPDGCDIHDPDGWVQANPSMGWTDLDDEAVRAACESDPEAIFRTEVLCQWVERVTPTALPALKWAQCLDEESTLGPEDPFALAVDVSWDRSVAHVSVAGARPDGLWHVQEIATMDPSDVCRWLADSTARRRPLIVAVQGSGAPASSLLDDLNRLGVPVLPLNGGDITKACGSFFDAVTTMSVRHTIQPDIEMAVSTAVSRPLGDAWALDRKKSPTDIAGLVAIVMALWAFLAEQGRTPQIIDPWAEEDE
jgi:phage terminase large subunit-like protein